MPWFGVNRKSRKLGKVGLFSTTKREPNRMGVKRETEREREFVGV